MTARKAHGSLKSPACWYVNEILSLLCGEEKSHNPASVKYWEIIADNLSKAGWSWGLRLSRGFRRANNLRC